MRLQWASHLKLDESTDLAELSTSYEEELKRVFPHRPRRQGGGYFLGRQVEVGEVQALSPLLSPLTGSMRKGPFRQSNTFCGKVFRSWISGPGIGKQLEKSHLKSQAISDGLTHLEYWKTPAVESKLRCVFEGPGVAEPGPRSSDRSGLCHIYIYIYIYVNVCVCLYLYIHINNYR